jgi:hypothetical protein
MIPSNEIAIDNQFAKFNTAQRQRKRIESDAVICSVVSNEAFDVASYNKARVLRIYRGNIWFASNIALSKDRYVYLGFNMNESDPTFNYNKFQLVRIKTSSESQNPFHRYHYQASYINSKKPLSKISHKPNFENQGLKNLHLQTEKDPRNIPRKSCHQSIFFYFKNRRHKGIITNLSRKGAYIETKYKLFFDQKIEIDVPINHSSEGFRLMGEVVRLDLNGVGLKLNRIIDTRQSYGNIYDPVLAQRTMVFG